MQVGHSTSRSASVTTTSHSVQRPTVGQLVAQKEPEKGGDRDDSASAKAMGLGKSVDTFA